MSTKSPARRSSTRIPRQEAMSLYAGGKDPRTDASAPLVPTTPGSSRSPGDGGTGVTASRLFTPSPATEVEKAGTISTPAPALTRAIGIYEINNGNMSQWEWLCGHHVKQRELSGWRPRRTGDVDQHCTDCSRERQPDTSGMVFPAPRRVASVGDVQTEATGEATEAA